MKKGESRTKVTRAERPSAPPLKEPAQTMRTLADFVARDMAANKDTARGWARKHHLANWDVDRVLNCAKAIGIDKLQHFADALQLEAWQLLWPGFERGAPLEAPKMSTELIDLARRLEAFEPEQRPRVYALMVQAVELARAAAPPSAPPVEPQKPSPESMRAPAKRR